MIYGNIPKGMVIDHINGDVRDNRLENLRLATRSGNSSNAPLPVTNSSGFKGVSAKNGRWRAYINVQGQQLPIGVFDCPVEAAKAYDLEAIRRFGEFARTNKMMGLYE